jgi:hypothetical protein
MQENGSDRPDISVQTDTGVTSSANPFIYARCRKRKWYIRRPTRFCTGSLGCPGITEEGQEVRVPSMRMRGMWLYQLGFRSGGWVTVGFDGKSLVLTPEDPAI